jgi:hypothetical protein
VIGRLIAGVLVGVLHGDDMWIGRDKRACNGAFVDGVGSGEGEGDPGPVPIAPCPSRGASADVPQTAGGRG